MKENSEVFCKRNTICDAPTGSKAEGHRREGWEMETNKSEQLRRKPHFEALQDKG